MKSIVVKWSGKEYPVELPEGDTVAGLKRVLQEQTRVDPKRQKLLGPEDQGWQGSHRRGSPVRPGDQAQHQGHDDGAA